MSKKMFENAQAPKSVTDSVGLTGSAEEMWRNMFYLGFSEDENTHGYERNSVDFILPAGKDLVASVNPGGLLGIKIGNDEWPWKYEIGLYYNPLESFPADRLQDCLFRYIGGEVPIRILRTNSELKGRATYVLDGFDQGGEDLLLTYNKFYPLKINYTEVEGWEAVVDLKKIKSISYPAGAKYTIDFIIGGQLAENQSGQSSAEGFPLNEMDPESNYVRMRYKNVNDVYYGEVSMVLHYEDTPVLRLTLPVEVIKPDVK